MQSRKSGTKFLPQSSAELRPNCLHVAEPNRTFGEILRWNSPADLRRSPTFGPSLLSTQQQNGEKAGSRSTHWGLVKSFVCACSHISSRWTCVSYYRGCSNYSTCSM